ncbi:CHASE2 domain-containing protein [Teichococcus rhizosphaerae]|uniref:CHASE2 domain-containing protein n=1 Tax=Teichococcus rhizosphaerae TaxID=1335062 RepID=UPI00159B9E69|nr:CHASE2 domain-containing protein [Pseudoroseomonas rhizosphaerae]
MWRKVCRTLVLGAFLMMGAYLDPFGFSALTQAASHRIEARLNAIWHPPVASEAVAVVMVNERSLRALDETWPPSFGFWSALIDSVNQRAPRTVFLDVVLGEERPVIDHGSPPLRRLIEDSNKPEAGLPRLLLADQSQWAFSKLSDKNFRRPMDCLKTQAPFTLCPTALAGSLQEAEARTTFINQNVHEKDRRSYALVERHVSGRHIPVAKAPPVPEPSRHDAAGLPDSTAPQGVQDSKTQSHSHAWISRSFMGPAAALSILEVTCQDEAAPVECAPFRQGAFLGELHKAGEPAYLIPRWRLNAAPAVARDIRALDRWSCTFYPQEEGLDRWDSKLWQSLGVVLTEAMSLGNEVSIGEKFGLPDWAASSIEHASDRSACLPFPLIPADMLLTPTNRPELLERLLRGRVVLIGTALASHPDRIHSPLHGTVPGVLLHATALDTLLRAGPDYPKPARPDSGIGDLLIKFSMLALACLSSIMGRQIIAGVFFLFLSFAAPSLYGIEMLRDENVAALMLFALGMAAEQFLEGWLDAEAGATSGQQEPAGR